MRKLFFSAALLVFISFQGFSQDADYKLGIKVAPILNSSRVVLDDPNWTMTDGNGSFKLSLGLVVDKTLTDRYILSTGLVYMPKEFELAVAADPSLDPQPEFNSSESYKLQYLQIPATLKLFTNEVKPDVAVYFQLGVAPEIKVYQEVEPGLDSNEVIAKFAPINLPVVLGAGFEYRAGLNTVAFAGFSYQRGLNNIVNTTDRTYADELSIRSTTLSRDLGIKF